MPARPGSAACPFPFRGVDDQGRPYVQPTHGLGARCGKALSGGATYENLGGRMILRHEHEEHLKRLHNAAPGIDNTMPRSFQERKRQQRLQQARFGALPASSSASASHSNHGGVAVAAIEGRASSSLAGSVGRLRSVVAAQSNTSGSAQQQQQNSGLALTQHSSASWLTPQRSKSRSSPTRQSRSVNNGVSNASSAAAAALIHERNVPAHDVYGTLPGDAQMICKSLVEVLEGLSTADSRTLLTQLLREAEEKRLLQAYTGVFPSMTNDASGYEQQHQIQQQHQQQQQQQQQQYSQSQSAASNNSNNYVPGLAAAHAPSNGRGGSAGGGSSRDEL